MQSQIMGDAFCLQGSACMTAQIAGKNLIPRRRGVCARP